jgi:hypothetical protein
VNVFTIQNTLEYTIQEIIRGRGRGRREETATLESETVDDR